MVDLTPEQQADVIYAFLKAGVPPSAVANALDLDPEPIRAVLAEIRVAAYGTDEIGEAMTHLIWVAYETALFEIRHGTPLSKARYMQMVLARSVGIAGKSSPEASEKIRAALAEMAAAAAPDIQLAESIYSAAD